MVSRRKPPQCTLRFMGERDLPRVQAIEAASYRNCWSRLDWHCLLNTTHDVTCRVAVLQGRVVGWSVVDQRGRSYRLWGLAVDPDYRRRGIGRTLVDEWTADVQRGELPSLRIDVSAAATARHLFLRACGFYCLGTRRRPRTGAELYCFRYDRLAPRLARAPSW